MENAFYVVPIRERLTFSFSPFRQNPAKDENILNVTIPSEIGLLTSLALPDLGTCSISLNYKFRYSKKAHALLFCFPTISLQYNINSAGRISTEIGLITSLTRLALRTFARSPKSNQKRHTRQLLTWFFTFSFFFLESNPLSGNGSTDLAYLSNSPILHLSGNDLTGNLDQTFCRRVSVSVFPPTEEKIQKLSVHVVAPHAPL